MKIPFSMLSAFSMLAFSAIPTVKFYPEKVAATPGTDGVWFMKAEVSNEEYKEFLLWVIGKNRADEIAALAPDMTVWTRDLAFNDPYMEYYLGHPAFDKYPVVGVDHAAAIAYCDYLTEKYKGAEIKSKTNIAEGMQVKFRLPTAEEWETAAGNGGHWSGYTYPGGFTYPRDHKGNFSFNHKLGRGDYAGYAGGTGDDYEGYMITAPVESFYAEKIGLYNMAGNVAEMVEEDGIAKGGSWAHEKDSCTIEARLHYTQSTAWLGFRPVFEIVEAPEE